jgi:hypothetical protein
VSSEGVNIIAVKFQQHSVVSEALDFNWALNHRHPVCVKAVVCLLALLTLITDSIFNIRLTSRFEK